MEPVWGLEKHAATGLQFWSRLDKNPQQRSVKFRCDVEVHEIAKETIEEDFWSYAKSWTDKTCRFSRSEENDSPHLLLAASLAVIAVTITYKWWFYLI